MIRDIIRFRLGDGVMVCCIETFGQIGCMTVEVGKKTLKVGEEAGGGIVRSTDGENTRITYGHFKNKERHETTKVSQWCQD